MKQNSEQKVEITKVSPTCGKPTVMGSTGNLRVLNLYAGIGGNRKLWDGVNVTAIEFNNEIASIYKDLYPNDEVVVGDAHEYLIKNYMNFDFIRSSPPCQSHSRIRKLGVSLNKVDAVFPDAKLWQEIVFLKHYFKGKFLVENVNPYYVPFIKPDLELQRHLIWANFKINPIEFEKTHPVEFVSTIEHFGVNIQKYKIKTNKQQILRNMVNPELGLYVLDQVRGIIRHSKTAQVSLFD